MLSIKRFDNPCCYELGVYRLSVKHTYFGLSIQREHIEEYASISDNHGKLQNILWDLYHGETNQRQMSGWNTKV